MSGIDVSLRLDLPGGGRFGLGKAALLEEIERNGSISGAARALGMSYPRALKLVEDMNSQFKSALIVTFQGGADRGGASVTAAGKSVLELYTNCVLQARVAAQPSFARLQMLLAN